MELIADAFEASPTGEAPHKLPVHMADELGIAGNGIQFTEGLNVSIVQQIKPWGTLTSTTFPGFTTRANFDGTTTCELTGFATFAKGGQKTYTVILVKQGGTFKVQSFNFK